ncbi:hypothetical protein BDZ89DRAFT_1041846 [Hymenopellis radicata]|nr:hypothetical protein BDZ89DRAFT_1041846 [Hymenopellis radicata]
MQASLPGQAETPTFPLQPVREKRGSEADAIGDSERARAAKGDKSFKAKLAATKRAAYLQEIAEIRVDAGNKVMELAKKYEKKKRAESTMDAKVSLMGVQVNSTLKRGEKLPAGKLRQLVKDDNRFENMSKEEEEVMMNWYHKTHSIASDHFAPTTLQLDATFRQPPNSLTKSMTISMTVRSHIDDTFGTIVYASQGAEKFFAEKFGKDLVDVGRIFEYWAMDKGLDQHSRETVDSMRKTITRLILEGLARITGRKNIDMEYAQYHPKIVAPYRIELRGWPTSIPFSTPSKLRAESVVRPLYKALVANTCHWVRLTDAEYQERVRAYVPPEKTRKERSDKNGSHRKAAGKDNAAAKENSSGGRV